MINHVKTPCKYLQGVFVAQNLAMDVENDEEYGRWNAIFSRNNYLMASPQSVLCSTIAR